MGADNPTVIARIACFVRWGLTVAFLVAPRGAERHAVAGEPPARDAPKAAVVEHVDPWTKGLGAERLLREAGFAVRPLRLDASPRDLGVDLIVVGSFASEHPAYRAFAAAHAEDLAAFVEKGGVVLEWTQAEQTEPEVPFLPRGFDVARCDDDFDALRTVVAGHPLLQGLVGDDGSVSIPRHLDRTPSWESLLRPLGFRSIVASDAEGRRPALVEAAHGKGRFLVTSLWLDKVDDASGKPAAPEALRTAAARFFANLKEYVAAVRRGDAPEVPREAAGPPPTGRIAWTLPDSRAVRYAVKRWATRDGKRESPPQGTLFVHGRAIRPDGVFRMDGATAADVPLVLGLSTPAATASGEVDFAFPLEGVANARANGKVRARTLPDARIQVDAEYAFLSAGHPKGDRAGPRLSDGEARVTLLFDPETSVVREAFGRVACTVQTTSGRQEKRERYVERFELRFESVRDAYEGAFREDVNGAIDRGVKYLRTLQKADGAFEPFHDWKVGTTALGLLALSSSHVPLSDPAIEKGLAWLCAEEPTRTYELAVGLMALERAYTPEEEVASLRVVPDGAGQRALPPARRAWCERVAKDLERAASSPGSWGYPPGPRALVQVDSSNTQYGVLGLRAAVRLGLPVKDVSWAGVVRHFEAVQEADAPAGTVVIVREGESVDGGKAASVAKAAGFRYSTREEEARATMTCAGAASLSLARYGLLRARSPRLTRKVEDEVDEMLLGAWAWLDRHWRIQLPKNDDWYGYLLYSLERAAILDRVKRLGGRDWYFEGALQLLARQKPDGSWTEGGGNGLTATCFALLFLQRATAPVAAITPGEGGSPPGR